jgi:hypothetical protein
VDLRAVRQKIVDAGKYQLDGNYQRKSLRPEENFFEVWPEPPPAGHLHIFISSPRGVNPSILRVWFSFLLVLGLFSNALSLFSPD